MKIISTLVIIGLTAIIMTSCHKESKTPIAGSSLLTGNWELRQTVGNNTGWGLSSGQFSNRLILNDDSTADKLFYQLEGDKLIVISGYFPTDGGIEKTYQKY